MEGISDFHKKVRFEALKALAFNTFLNASILFLALNFVLSFFGIPYVISLLPALAYFFKSFIGHMRKFDLKEFESRNPDLAHIVNIAQRSASHRHALSDTMFDKLVKNTRTAIFFNLVTSKRIREKIYALVFLALLAILVGSFHLYPTKVFFRVSDIDLTQPSLWTNIYERIEIQKPEFASCYAELNYTNKLFGETSSELVIVKDQLKETDSELSRSKDDLSVCSKELNRTEPYVSLYEQEKHSLDETGQRLGDCNSNLESLRAEKAALIAEKTAYITENADLRERVDDLRDELAECTG